MWEGGAPSKNVHICDVILMCGGEGALKKYFWCRRSVMIGVLVFVVKSRRACCVWYFARDELYEHLKTFKGKYSFELVWRDLLCDI